MLDDTNRRILRHLQENARIPYSELGKLVNLSPPAVAERIRRMEADGIIKKFSVAIDPAQLGYPIAAFVQARVFLGKEAALVAFVRTVDEVLVCHNVTGEKAFLMQVAVRSMLHLDELLERFAAICETTTMLTLSTPVDMRMVGLEPP